MKKLIKEVLSSFDFEMVYMIMKSLNWTWHFKEVPSVQTLKEEAQKLLEFACKECLVDRETSRCIPYVVGTGGLRAEAWPNKKKTKIKELNLEFVLVMNGAIKYKMTTTTGNLRKLHKN